MATLSTFIFLNRGLLGGMDPKTGPVSRSAIPHPLSAADSLGAAGLRKLGPRPARGVLRGGFGRLDRLPPLLGSERDFVTADQFGPCEG